MIQNFAGKPKRAFGVLEDKAHEQTSEEELRWPRLVR